MAMTHLLIILLLLPAGVPYRFVQQCTGMESPAAYELTIDAVVPILPPPLGTFLEDNRSEFHDLVIADVEAEIREQKTASARHWHYVELDIEAPVADAAQRSAAVGRFPREKEKAKELFERLGSSPGGVLPWIIEERYQNLEHALRTGNRPQALQAAAELLHYCADAAMPPQTSACCFSVESCSQPFAAEGPRRLYHRTFTAFQEVLAFEIRIHPDRVTPSARPLDDAFATATQAYGSLEHVLASSYRCGQPETTARAFAVDADPACGHKWGGLPTAALPYMKMQLESGALLAVNLIVGAWEEAGRPDLKPVTVPPAPAKAEVVAAAPPSNAAANESLFVGSQSGGVYHRASCSHAARIKAENRVSFETAAQAQSAGRTPCKACKPDAGNP